MTNLPYPENKFDAVFSCGGVMSYTKKLHQVLKTKD
ncbi:MAG: hypothetical protein ACFFAU_18545 [Candidatus Hodarchaeota archaeon]